MKGMKKKQNKKKISIKNNKYLLHIVMIFFVLLLMFFCVALSYAFWNSTVYQTNKNMIEAGCLSFTYNDKDVEGNITSIYMSNSYPMSDNIGLSTKPYEFTIKNTCTLNASYNIYLNTLTTSTLDSKYMKYNLIDAAKSFDIGPAIVGNLSTVAIDEEINSIMVEKVGEIKNSYLIHTLSLQPNESITLNLRLWIDYDAPNSIMGQNYNSALSVVSTVSE